jgi:diphthine synthase
MTLTIIGVGLGNEADITVKGLEAVKARDVVEKQAEARLIGPAKDKNICLLIVGDVFSATTHVDLALRAKEAGVQVHVIHNASILSAIGATGLSVYKIGKVTSIPFEYEQVSTPYQYLEQNKSIGAHTLFLLDLRPSEGKFLGVVEAITYLHSQETKHQKKLVANDQRFVACARIGSPDQLIAYGTLEDFAKVDFGRPPYCLIVPGTLHFMEEEAIERYAV